MKTKRVGEVLREAREKHSLSIEQLTEFTHIKK
jgi:cytoskeletal protein RodZ